MEFHDEFLRAPAFGLRGDLAMARGIFVLKNAERHRHVDRTNIDVVLTRSMSELAQCCDKPCGWMIRRCVTYWQVFKQGINACDREINFAG